MKGAGPARHDGGVHVRFVVFGLIVFGTATAQAEPRAVTLDEARAAVEKAPAQYAARMRTAASSAAVRGAGGWPATDVAIGTSRAARVVGTLAIPLPLTGAARGARGVARADADVARAEERVSAVDLRLEVTVAWLELYLAGQRAQLAAENVKRFTDVEHATEARRTAGDASTAEVTYASAQTARSRVDAETAEGAVVVAGTELAALLGWDETRALVAAGPLPVGDPHAPPSIADLDLVAYKTDAARAAVQDVVASSRPAFRIEMEVDALAPDDTPSDVKVLLGVEIPLFGRRGGRIDAARARVAAATAEADAERARLRANQSAALARWSVAQRRATAFIEELVPAQTRSTDLVRAAYTAGESDLSTMLQAERDLLAVQSERVEAEVDAARAWATLERLGGAP
jgi:cobalt-zinc-cadmium efflux system outer membrane protein